MSIACLKKIKKFLANFRGAASGLLRGPLKIFNFAALNFALLIFALACPARLGAAQSFYFYSPAEIAAMRQSAKSARGEKIVENLERVVERRRSYSLEVPEGKIGRHGNYICPVHKHMLMFDLASPHSHFCPSCEKFYEGAGYDSAWRLLLHLNANVDYLRACSCLYLITGEKTYARYICEMLLDYAKVYRTYPDYSDEQVKKAYHLGKMFDQWLDECIWYSDVCKAFNVALPEMSQSEANTIRKEIFKKGADMMLKREGGNNWQVINCIGRASLGVALEDASLIDIAVNGKTGLKNIMPSMLNSDGWFNENSPSYHFMVVENMMLARDAAKCAGIDLFAEEILDMCLKPLRGAYADLTFPAFNDGWYALSLTTLAPLYEKVYAYSKNPEILGALSKIYARVGRESPESLLNNIEIPKDESPLSGSSFVFEKTGNAVLKAGNATLTLRYGRGEGGHQHPDRLALTYHDGTRELLRDSGTLGYGNPLYRVWYQQTLAHNSLAVDGQSQNIRARNSGGRLEFFDEKSNSLCAEANNVYEGVKLRRFVKLNSENSFCDKFECASEKEHTYDFSFILSDEPKFENLKLSPAEFSEGGPYRCISGLKTCEVAGAEALVSAGRLKISLRGSGAFKIYTGLVAGASSASDRTLVTKKPDPIEGAHILIIRIKSKCATLESRFEVEKN